MTTGITGYLVDTHCHLEMYVDREQIASEAVAKGVRTVAVTNRPSEFRGLNQKFGGRLDYVSVGIGLHPEVANSPYERPEMSIFQEQLPAAEWIAEIGLDGHLADGVSPHFGSIPTLASQKLMLERILSLPLGDRPMSVHSRGAQAEVLEMLKAANVSRAAFHWYSGSRDNAVRILDAGYYFSVNPDHFESAEGRAFISWLPGRAMLLESDGPFVPWRGKVVTPADMAELVLVIAELRGEDPDEVHGRIADNFRKFIGSRAVDGGES